jgi:two-component system chemotaxis response regulator CheY
MKTLIVEDDPASRTMMQAMLKTHGECILASNGKEAIDSFYSALQQDQLFDLVCLDIMMPGVTGHEVLMNIREIEEDCNILPPKNVKIIMTSALNDKENVIGAFIN